MTKKIVSMLVATLMALSLCTTAFAAISPSELPYAYASATTDEGLKDGEELKINTSSINQWSCSEEEYEASKQLVNNQDSVIEVLENNGIDVPADAEMVLISAGEYKAYIEHYGEDWSDYYREDYNGPLTLTLDLASIGSDAADGDTVFVLHYTANGMWEVFECVVVDGKVTVDLNSLSPILVYKMMSDGTVSTVEPDVTETTEETVKETIETTTTTTESTVSTVSTLKKSPYTGA